jgi:membrane fusion protein (multidrug efflux system)
MKKKIILIILFIASGLLFLRFFKHNGQGQAQPEERTRAPRSSIVVKAAPLQKERFTVSLDYIGSLKAQDETNVFSKVTGKLVDYSVNEGDQVTKGQNIASIDRDETGLKFELAKVESPISGLVGRILLDKGANIIPNTTVLAIIVDMDQMKVRLNIPEQDIPYLKKGLKAIIQVDAYPEEEFQGEISRVAQMADPETRTLPIEISIPNKDHRLKSGMFCRIKIIAAVLDSVLVLSQDSVVQELGERFVFTVENNIANKQKVVLGRRDNGKFEVLKGVQENDIVIIFGQQGLKDGTPVTISNNQ